MGGGAIGAACARELARARHRVLVLERGTDRGAAWRAAAGMLAPQIEASPADPLFPMGLAGREWYRELARPIKERTGIDIGFWQEGIARLAVDDADVPALQARVAWQRQQGHDCEWLDPDRVAARWPWVGANGGALFAPNEAALHPGRLVAALLKDAEHAGARIVEETVLGLERRGDRIVGVVGSQTWPAEHVVITAGAWSQGLAGLPRPLPVTPIRGQMASFPWPADVPPAIVYGKDAYLVARDGEAIAGSTMENAGFDTEVTAVGLAYIFKAVTALCPALSNLDVLRTWSGLRPMTPDGLPIIGKEPRVEGLWYATGHGRNGILLAGITGVIVRQLLTGEAPALDLSPFRPQRFFEW